MFGLLSGLVISHFALKAMRSLKAGSEFENVAELRAAMLQDSPSRPGNTLNLRELINPHPNDRIIFDLRPGLDVTFQGERVTTNSCGMRDKERSLRKPPGTYRIALLGDSFAFGWGVHQDRSFAAVLERELNRLAAGRRKFEVLNFGVPGYSTFQEVELFKEKGLDFEPDAVLVYFVSNDFGFPFYVHDIQKQGGLLPAVEFVQLARRAFQPAMEQQRLIEAGLDPNRALKQLAEIAQERGMDLKIMINLTKNMKELVRQLWVLRTRPDIGRIRFAEDLKKMIELRGLTPRELQLPSDPHPSAAKHELLGLLIVPYYMNLI